MVIGILFKSKSDQKILRHTRIPKLSSVLSSRRSYSNAARRSRTFQFRTKQCYFSEQFRLNQTLDIGHRLIRIWRRTFKPVASKVMGQFIYGLTRRYFKCRVFRFPRVLHGHPLTNPQALH